MSAVRVGDLVEVRPIRTVIRLGDAAEASCRGEIAGAFVPTPEASKVLRAAFSRMAGRSGEGLFVQGPYGSGKSHLLAYLGMAAEEATPRTALADDRELAPLLEKSPPGSWLVANLPLVDHPARTPLETLVVTAVARALAARSLPSPEPPEEDRRGWLSRLSTTLGEAGLQGLLLLVDELSEFLRAKPDARAFTEDIRFLQFLGERAADIPAVIVIGLQDAIDETGPIAPTAFAKIKDRYPQRFVLTADHVGELVRRRILAPRPGARAQVESIYRRLHACLPHWQIDAESFRKLYPVHPATLLFLEHLKPLFSQHRGVVEFLVTRLSGSPERGVAPLLDAPAGTLLTADLILDHFRERIRERIETAPLVDEVLAWWEENLPGLFPRPDEQQLALRSLKVLALASLFPFAHPVSIRQMAEILTVTVTDLEPSINEHMVADVLDRMASRGAYVVRQAPDDRRPLGATYLLQRGADGALVARAKVRELVAELTGRTDEILRAMTSVVDASHLPLATLANQGRVRRTVSWQSTLREGWVVLGDPSGLQPDERDAMAREVQTTETDFYFYVVPPAAEPPAGLADPALAALPLLAWVPRPVEDVAFLAEARARQLLARKLEGDSTPRSKEILRSLAPALEDDRRHLTEMAGKAYFSGQVVGPGGQVKDALSGGLPAFDRILERSVSTLLELRHPRHFTVAPSGVGLSRQRLGELIDTFLRPGSLASPHSASPAVRPIIEGYLKSLALVARTGGSWSLRVDPARAEAARDLLELVGDPTGVEDLYWRFRKGPLGLTRPCFELLLCCLVFSGHLIPLAQGRRVALERFSSSSLDSLSQVEREVPLPAEVATALTHLPFLSPKLASQPPGPTLTRQLWEELQVLRSRSVLGLGGLAAKLAHARRDGLLDHLNLEEAAEALDSFTAIVSRIKVGGFTREGLVDLYRKLVEAGLVERLRAMRPLLRFLEDDAQSYMAMATYLRQEELEIPSTPSHMTLVLRLEELRKRVCLPETCLDEASFAAFRREFDAFLELYVEAYVADHQARRSQAALAPITRVASSAPLRFLQSLCRSPLAVPPQALPRLEANLEAASRYACTRLTAFALRTRATCSCGHRLGERPPVEDAATLQGWLDSAIREALASLASPDRARDLARARAQSEEWGQLEEAALLGELASLGPDLPDLGERLARLAASPVEKVLDRIASVQKAPERDLDELAARLAGKLLTCAQVMQIVSEWLGDVQESATVRIPRPGSARLPAGPGSDPGAWPAARDLAARTGMPDALAASLLAFWAREHGVPLAAAARAVGLAPGPEPGWDELARLGHELATRSDPGEVGRLVSPWSSGPPFEGLFDLVARGAGPTRIFKALQSEHLFPELARRLAVLGLQALAVTGEVSPEGSGLEPPDPFAPRGDARCPAGTQPQVVPFQGLVREAMGLVATIAALESRRGRKATSAQGWESRFGRLVPLPLVLARAEARAAQLDLSAELGSTGVAARVRRFLAGEAEEFACVYRELVPTIWTGSEGPLWIHRVLPVRLERILRELKTDRACVAMVDGMRWDVFRLLESEYLGTPRARLRKLEESAVWALAPTLTSINVAALWTGRPPPQDQLLAGARDEAGTDAISPDTPPALPGVDLRRLGQLDEQLHASTLGLDQLCDSILPAVAARLEQIVEPVPAGGVIAVTADHGFVENPEYRPHGPARRYRHGGLDPFEVLVPLAVFQKL